MERSENFEKGEEAVALVATGENVDFYLHQHPDVLVTDNYTSLQLCTEDYDEFPLHGITLRGFQNFIEACGVEDALRNMMWNMMCTQVKDKCVIENFIRLNIVLQNYGRKRKMYVSF